MSRYFKVETNKPPISYKVGEKIVFSISVRNNHETDECRSFKWELTQDDGVNLSGTGAKLLQEPPFVIETSLSRPGFVRLQIFPLNEDGSADTTIDPLDAGAGASVEEITYHGTVPEDYDEYWQNIEKMIEDFTPQLIQKTPYYGDIPAFEPKGKPLPVREGTPDFCDCYDIRVTTPNGDFASGMMCVPKGEGKFPMEISFRGYAVAGASPSYSANSITINFNAHGIENGFTVEALRAKYPRLANYGFDKTENERPETTYWQGMMIRNLAGVKWAKTLENWDGKNLLVYGGSQAAFQAMVVAAHTEGVSLLRLYVPWFCDLNLEKQGYLGGWRPAPQAGLEYYDTVTHAMHAKCPVEISAFLGDYCCPPTSVMALYNAIPTEKKILFTQSGTHGYRPPEREKCYLYTSKAEVGRYRHYKGGIYDVLYVGTNSETLEREVVYKQADGDGVWVRPEQMWNDYVRGESGYVKRFTKID